MEKALRCMDEYGARITKKDHFILIDYDLPIVRKRLWLMETPTRRVVLSAHVSHALKSGLLFVRTVSNTPGSNTSCVGPFVTDEHYHGDYGYAMRLDGLALGVNHNARDRAIVFHSFWPLEWIPFPGWTKGCFMTAPRINERLIDTCAHGRFVFVHYSHREDEKPGLDSVRGASS